MFEDKQTAIETYLKANFTQVPIVVFENDPSPAATLYDEWARATVQFGDAKRMQIGGGAYRYFGILMIQIFLKEGIGVNRGVELADVLDGFFKDHVLDGVFFQVPYVTKMPFADSGWFQLQTTIPFYFDEVN